MRTVLIDIQDPTLKQLQELGKELYYLQSQYTDEYHKVETTILTTEQAFKVPYWWIQEQYSPDYSWGRAIEVSLLRPGINVIQVDLVTKYPT